VHGQNLDWRRFVTDQTVDFMRAEISPLKAAAPELPVTTNLMGTYPGLDYWKLAPHLDVVSWDSYPGWHGAGAIPGGLTANRAWVAGRVRFAGVDEVLQALLCDPQTSGGLLAAIAPDAADAFRRACAARRVLAAPVGRVTGGPAGTATVT